MNGSSDQSDETPAAPSDATRGREIRRFDAPHPQPRMRSLRAIRNDHDDRADIHEPVGPAGSSGPADASSDEADDSLEAELPNCERVADRLMSTQAAQLAEYLRSRQSELARQQRQLDEQQQALSKARQAQVAVPDSPQSNSPGAGAPPGPSVAAAASAVEPAQHTPASASRQSPPAPHASRRATTSSASPTVAAEPAPGFETECSSDNAVEAARQAAAARQLLAEARRIQLETLEQRLIVEQLRFELSAQAPHIDLQAAYRRLQTQFQRQHRQAWEALAEQEDETRELLAELDQRQTQLRRQRRDLQNWVARRYEDFEQLIGRLAAREQELDRQQRELDEARQHEGEQAAEYQRQIRQLTAQLRCRDELGRVA